MVRRRQQNGRRNRRSAQAGAAYVLVSRGPDGRSRSESFRDSRAYRTRLASIGAGDGPVSLDEVVDLLAGVSSEPNRGS